jgi:hypothetical protein
MGQINHTAVAWRNPQIAPPRCSNGQFPDNIAIGDAYLGSKAVHRTASPQLQVPNAGDRGRRRTA